MLLLFIHMYTDKTRGDMTIADMENRQWTPNSTVCRPPRELESAFGQTSCKYIYICILSGQNFACHRSLTSITYIHITQNNNKLLTKEFNVMIVSADERSKNIKQQQCHRLGSSDDEESAAGWYNDSQSATTSSLTAACYCTAHTYNVAHKSHVIDAEIIEQCCHMHEPNFSKAHAYITVHL